MGCYEIFFLQRFNFVPRGCIVLDRTHCFHGILDDLPENLILRKILSPGRLSKKAGIFLCEHMKTITHFRKNMMVQPSFMIKKNIRLGTRLRRPNYESSLVANILQN